MHRLACIFLWLKLLSGAIKRQHALLHWASYILITLLFCSFVDPTHEKSEARRMKSSISKEKAIEIARKRAINESYGMFSKPYVDSVRQQSETGDWVVKILSSKPESESLGRMYLYVIIDEETGSVLSV